MRAALVLGFILSLSSTAAAADPLPQGDAGIAGTHPYDVDIDTDPAVLFADDFEDYVDASQLGDRWDAVYQNDLVRIAKERSHAFYGEQALEFKVPQQDAELSNATDKIVSPERDVLFLRYYSKFEPPYDVVGSSHNGSMISAHYFIDGQATPGIPADGMNKFLAAFENWRGEPETPSPGKLNIYAYHPEQRSEWGDHLFPTGEVLPYSMEPFDFGPDFVAMPDIIPELDRWYCFEYMVQANTPGQRDGRIAFWLDGQLAADFQNLRLRDIDSLKIDRFGLSFHIHSNPGGETRKWYDNVVAATSYIGPMYVPEPDETTGPGTTSGDSGDPTTGGTSSPTSGASGSAGTSGTTGDPPNTSSGPEANDGSASEDSAATSGGADDSSGCACGTTGSHPLTALALLPLLAIHRRRRRARG